MSLCNVSRPSGRAPRIVVLTGERGIGKSTVCHRTLALAKEQGRTCGGVYTVSNPDGSRDLVDARTGDVRRLTIGPDAGPAPAIVQGRFRFDREALAWAGGLLGRATPCDLFVVDELGPLEVERGEGLAAAFDVLAGGGFRLALVVVRPELVERVRSLVPTVETTVVTVTRDNRESLPRALVSTLQWDTD